jgi:hypothetical protein
MGFMEAIRSMNVGPLEACMRTDRQLEIAIMSSVSMDKKGCAQGNKNCIGIDAV